jgi:hypothetical protein
MPSLQPPRSANFPIPETPAGPTRALYKTAFGLISFLHRIILCRSVPLPFYPVPFSHSASPSPLRPPALPPDLQLTHPGFLYSHCSLMLVHTSHKFHVEAMIQYPLGSLTEAFPDRSRV